MANENGKTPTQAQPQMIPLSKIHELPGVFNPKPQDKSLGSMVLSIESSGIKEPAPAIHGQGKKYAGSVPESRCYDSQGCVLVDKRHRRTFGRRVPDPRYLRDGDRCGDYRLALWHPLFQ